MDFFFLAVCEKTEKPKPFQLPNTGKYNCHFYCFLPKQLRLYKLLDGVEVNGTVVTCLNLEFMVNFNHCFFITETFRLKLKSMDQLCFVTLWKTLHAKSTETISIENSMCFFSSPFHMAECAGAAFLIL